MPATDYIPRRTGADSANTLASVAYLPAWELIIGTVQLFIAGPGHNPDSWLAVSKSYYRGQVGSDDERRRARRAVAWLNRHQRENKDATADDIRAALVEANRPDAAAAPEPAPTPAAAADQERRNLFQPSKLVHPTDRELIAAGKRVLSEVSRRTGLPPAAILGPERDTRLMRARTLAARLLRDRHPLWVNAALAAILCRGKSTICQLLYRHPEYERTSPIYAAHYAALSAP